MSKGLKAGRPGRFPGWYRGRLRNEVHGDAWYGEREGKLFKREGKLVDKANYDVLTEAERAENLASMVNRERNKTDFFDT